MDSFALFDTIRAWSTDQKDSSHSIATILPEYDHDTNTMCSLHKVSTCQALKQYVEKGRETFLPLHSSTYIEPSKLAQLQSPLFSPLAFS
jgi:hypothetical protein